MLSPFHTIFVVKKPEFDGSRRQLIEGFEKLPLQSPLSQFFIKSATSFKIYYIGSPMPASFLKKVAKEVVADPICEEFFVNECDFSNLIHPFHCVALAYYRDGITDNEATTLYEGMMDFADFSGEKLDPFCVRSGRGWFLQLSSKELKCGGDENFSQADHFRATKEKFEEVLSVPSHREKWNHSLAELIVGQSITETVFVKLKSEIDIGYAFPHPNLSHPVLLPHNLDEAKKSHPKRVYNFFSKADEKSWNTALDKMTHLSERITPFLKKMEAPLDFSFHAESSDNFYWLLLWIEQGLLDPDVWIKNRQSYEDLLKLKNYFLSLDTGKKRSHAVDGNEAARGNKEEEFALNFDFYRDEKNFSLSEKLSLSKNFSPYEDEVVKPSTLSPEAKRELFLKTTLLSTHMLYEIRRVFKNMKYKIDCRDSSFEKVLENFKQKKHPLSYTDDIESAMKKSGAKDFYDAFKDYLLDIQTTINLNLFQGLGLKTPFNFVNYFLGVDHPSNEADACLFQFQKNIILTCEKYCCQEKYAALAESELQEKEKESKRKSLKKRIEELEKEVEKFSGDPTAPLVKRFEEISEAVVRGDAFFCIPTKAELELIAQTWSEHCKHRIFSASISYVGPSIQATAGVAGDKALKIDSLFKTFIKAVTDKLETKRTDLLSVFSDNAGIVSFGDDHAIACKVETHNAPSAIDPFGGAITGIVGVNRDIIGAGLGFEPICNIDVLCFGSLQKKNTLGGKTALHLRGVHRGIERGGNESGIPTVAGAFVFHSSYEHRPLVYCGTIGIAPKKVLQRSIEEKKIMPGDCIAVVGGRVGRDGIHGATASSDVIGGQTPASVVQVADPITQRKVLDFVLQARDKNLFRAITDNGAGGLASSVGEMALLSNGAWLELDKVPLKEQGLEPWEVLISESQERMTMAVPPENKSEISKLAAKMGCEISFVGLFNDNGYFFASYGNEVVCKLELDFLHNGAPKMELEAQWKKVEPKNPKYTRDLLNSFMNSHPCREKKSYGGFLHHMLQRENIASKETLVRQFDHEVKGQTILKPFDGPAADAPMDAAVLRPIATSNQGVVVALGLAARYGEVDACSMAGAAIDEAVRGSLCVGAQLETMVGLDNFCWPDPLPAPDNPNAKHKLAQLVRANQTLKKVCLDYQLPIVSGKDSMKNDYRFKEVDAHGKEQQKRKSIVPTLLFTVVAQVKDCRRIVTTTFKKAGSRIYLLGCTHHELGCSEASGFILENSKDSLQDTRVPYVRSKTNRTLYEKLSKAIDSRCVDAAHDLSDGGLAVALAESCFGGGRGAEIDLSCIDIFEAISSEEFGNEEFEKLEQSPKAMKGQEEDFSFVKLFSESQGRFIVEVSEKNASAFEKIMEGSHCQSIGVVSNGDCLSISDNGEVLLNEKISELKESWKSTFLSYGYKDER